MTSLALIPQETYQSACKQVKLSSLFSNVTFLFFCPFHFFKNFFFKILQRFVSMQYFIATSHFSVPLFNLPTYRRKVSVPT